MIILIVFAFLAGVVTILSPCILPVLPIVLSGSVGGDKRKPLGVVTGFVLSFTFFTLFLSTIVQLTGIPADSLRAFSIVILIVFGISLLVPQVQQWIELAFSKLANMGPKQKAPVNSFWGGVVVGVSLGILWTPCVGPILASVISLALTGSVSGAAAIITLAYALGTAIPMLAITYGGRQLLTRVPWLLQNTGAIQKAFGVLMIITAIGIYFNVDRRFQTYILEAFPQYGVGLTAIEDNSLVQDQLELLGEEKRSGDTPRAVDEMRGKPMNMMQQYPLAPELIPGGEWFNSDPLTLAELAQQDKVVLIDFWTYSCINCIRTLPYLRTWHEKYADDGLVIIGVHAPEFEFEKDPENVQQAISDFQLEYPVVQDNEFSTWRAYENRYWPAKYLIDKDGRVRYYHFGEGAYDETEAKIQELLNETGSTVESAIDNPDYEIFSRTPELYLGYWRIEYLVSPEQLREDQQQTYSAPARISDNGFAYIGPWTVTEKYAIPAAGSSLQLNFEAREVFLVMRSTDGSPHPVEILLNGTPVSEEQKGEDVTDGIVTVQKDRLYKLIKLPNAGRELLELRFPEGNIEVYAFTFG